MKYCIEFFAVRVENTNDKSVMITTSSNSGNAFYLPLKYKDDRELTEVEYFKEQVFKENPNEYDMARIVVPEWLYEKHEDNFKLISFVSIEQWENNKVNPIFTNRPTK